MSPKQNFKEWVVPLVSLIVNNGGTTYPQVRVIEREVYDAVKKREAELEALVASLTAELKKQIHYLYLIQEDLEIYKDQKSYPNREEIDNVRDMRLRAMGFLETLNPTQNGSKDFVKIKAKGDTNEQG